MSLTLESAIARSPDIMYGDLGGEGVMMNIDAGAYYGMNEVANRIWTLADEPIRLSEVVDQLTAEYDVARPDCETAVLDFARAMIGDGLLRATDPPSEQVG